jgi:hypothetical protein
MGCSCARAKLTLILLRADEVISEKARRAACSARGDTYPFMGDDGKERPLSFFTSRNVADALENLAERV